MIFTFGFYLSLVWLLSKALAALPGFRSPFAVWLRGGPRCDEGNGHTSRIGKAVASRGYRAVLAVEAYLPLADAAIGGSESKCFWSCWICHLPGTYLSNLFTGLCFGILLQSPSPHRNPVCTKSHQCKVFCSGRWFCVHYNKDLLQLDGSSIIRWGQDPLYNSGDVGTFT